MKKINEMIETVAIGSVLLNQDNPRILKDDKFKKLVKSVKEFPQMLQIRPIVVNSDMVVLGGNMRLQACKKAGLKEVTIIKADNLTEEQQKEFIIKDNVGFGEWDWDMINNDWNTEEVEEWGLDIPEFEVDEVLETEEDEFDVPNGGIETDIVLGDLFEIGEHRLLCGDSTSSGSMELLMNGKFADLAHNDPPYGMKKEKDGVLNDNLNFDDLLQFNHDWIPLQWSHLKENGSWYCWGIDEPLMDVYCDIIKPYIQQGKASFRNLITWNKGHGQGQNSELTRSFANADEKCLFVMMGMQDLNPSKDNFPEEWRGVLNYLKNERDKVNWKTSDVITITGKSSASHYFTESQFLIPTEEHYNKLKQEAKGKAFQKEFKQLKKEASQILDGIKNKRAYFNNTHDNMNNVWNFERTSQTEREHTGGHATPKPLELCERAIKSSCPEQGLVVDAFLGSGSTMVASHQLNRKCYGMELDPKYCQVIVNRMLKLDPTLEVKLNGKKYEPITEH